MDVKNLIINAVLAGFWAGFGALQTGEITKAALYAAGALALRAAIGYLSDAVGHPVRVDKEVS